MQILFYIFNKSASISQKTTAALDFFPIDNLNKKALTSLYVRFISDRESLHKMFISTNSKFIQISKIAHSYNRIDWLILRKLLIHEKPT